MISMPAVVSAVISQFSMMYGARIVPFPFVTPLSGVKLRSPTIRMGWCAWVWALLGLGQVRMRREDMKSASPILLIFDCLHRASAPRHIFPLGSHNNVSSFVSP